MGGLSLLAREGFVQTWLTCELARGQNVQKNGKLICEHPPPPDPSVPAVSPPPPATPPGHSPSAERRSRDDRGAGAPGRQRPDGAEDGALALRHRAAPRQVLGDRAMQPPEHQASGEVAGRAPMLIARVLPLVVSCFRHEWVGRCGSQRFIRRFAGGPKRAHKGFKNLASVFLKLCFSFTLKPSSSLLRRRLIINVFLLVAATSVSARAPAYTGDPLHGRGAVHGRRPPCAPGRRPGG